MQHHCACIVYNVGIERVTRVRNPVSSIVYRASNSNAIRFWTFAPSRKSGILIVPKMFSNKVFCVYKYMYIYK